MRTSPIALRATATAVVLGALVPCGTGAARAADGVVATVSPTGADAGGRVRVTVDGCADGRAAVSSGAFARAVTLRGAGRLRGEAAIRPRVADGSYAVDVTCAGHRYGGAGRLRVGAAASHRAAYAPADAAGGGAVPAADPESATAPAVANAPAVAAAAAAPSGLGRPYTLTGLGLAALAAVTVAYRSARRRRSAGS